ncbi:MAG: lysylphosphatidylglycerol synthase transmembrane domain-containing protein [Anaerolineae bacterium]
MRRAIFILASVAVSGLFLWLAARDVPLDEVITNIQQADFGWILLSMIFISLGLWLRGVRWYGLLDFKAPLIQVCHILNLGFLLNLLPLRLGEVARSILVTRAGVPVVTAATSIVLERMLDTLLVVLLLVFAIGRIPDIPPEIVKTTTVFGVAVVIAFIVMIVFARFPEIGHKVLDFVERLLPFLKRLGLDKLFDQMLDGLKPLTHLRSAVYVIVWTLISWSVSFLTLYSLVRALNVSDTNQVPLDEGTRLLLTILGLTLASFSIAIPISVGGVGPFEAAIRLAGSAVGALPAHAISLGILFHAINIFGYALWGIIGLLVMGVSLSDVLNRKMPESSSQ